MTPWPAALTERLPVAGADALAAEARGALVADDCPLALRRACEAARVRVLHKPLRVGRHRHTAMLVPTRHGFSALVDSELWGRAAGSALGRRRLRFVLAHELGHTFFYRAGSPPTRLTHPTRSEEQFCHRFATSLLVPSPAALGAALDPGGLYGLADRYDVSLRVASWAVARARPDITVLWLQRAAHPRRGGLETMRVEWGASSRFVAPGESFKSELSTLAPGEHGQLSQRLRLGGRDQDVTLAAWRFASAMLVIVRERHAEDLGHTALEWPAQLALFS